MTDDMLEGLVEGERASLVTDDDAKEETWNRVSRSVAVGAPVAGFGTGKAVVAKAGLSYGKGLAALLLTGAAAVGVYEIAGDRQAPATTPAVTQTTHDDAPAEPTPAVAPDARPTGPVQTPEPVDEAAVVSDEEAMPTEARVQRPAASRPAPAVAEAAPAQDAASALAEEARLLADARRKLKAGQADAALKVLADHATRFARGQLREERLALQARALCRSGDLEGGRRQADALRTAFPSSSHADRVARACGESTTP